MSDNWIEDMLARGYSKGPAFQSYDEMSAWDKTNTRPHVRSAVGAGYQVCFTDGQTFMGAGVEAAPSGTVGLEPKATEAVYNVNADCPF
jgi:hypothetical protein